MPQSLFLGRAAQAVAHDVSARRLLYDVHVVEPSPSCMLYQVVAEPSMTKLQAAFKTARGTPSETQGTEDTEVPTTLDPVLCQKLSSLPKMVFVVLLMDSCNHVTAEWLRAAGAVAAKTPTTECYMALTDLGGEITYATMKRL